MYYFRSGEVGVFNKENFESFLMMLLKQNGYPGENATKTVGDYYLIFTPFIVIGFLRCIKRLVLSIKKREFNFESLIGLWFLISFILASNISYINTNRANYIHIPIIIFSITGIETILNKLPWLSKITAFATVLAFFAFIVPFFDSDTQLHYSLTNDYSQVLDYTEKYIEENDVKVYLDNAISPIQYSHLFYHTKPAPAEVVEHLEKTWYGLGENYKNYHFAHNDIISFEDGAIYVYPKEWEGYITYNFSVEKIFETSSEYVIFKKIS
jgi:uncharacterized membrane protein